MEKQLRRDEETLTVPPARVRGVPPALPFPSKVRAPLANRCETAVQMPALTGAKNVCLHFEDTTAIISVDLTTTHGPNASASKTLIGTTLGYKPIGSTGALMWLTVSMEAGKAVDLSGDVPCPDGLKNCTLEVEGPMLKISVDLTQVLQRVATGQGAENNQL